MRSHAAAARISGVSGLTESDAVRIASPLGTTCLGRALLPRAPDIIIIIVINHCSDIDRPCQQRSMNYVTTILSAENSLPPKERKSNAVYHSVKRAILLRRVEARQPHLWPAI